MPCTAQFSLLSVPIVSIVLDCQLSAAPPASREYALAPNERPTPPKPGASVVLLLWQQVTSAIAKLCQRKERCHTWQLALRPTRYSSTGRLELCLLGPATECVCPNTELAVPTSGKELC